MGDGPAVHDKSCRRKVCPGIRGVPSLLSCAGDLCPCLFSALYVVIECSYAASIGSGVIGDRSAVHCHNGVAK